MIKVTLANHVGETYFNVSHITEVWASPSYRHNRGGSLRTHIKHDRETYEVEESMETILSRLRQVVGVGDCE